MMNFWQKLFHNRKQHRTLAETAQAQRQARYTLLAAFLCLLLLLYLAVAPLFPGLPVFPDPQDRPLDYGLLQLWLTMPLLALARADLVRGVKALRDSAPSMASLFAATCVVVLLQGAWTLALGVRGVPLARMLLFAPLGLTCWLTGLATHWDRMARQRGTEVLTRYHRQKAGAEDPDVVAQLEALVAASLAARMPLKRTLDRFAGTYVPVALAIALAAGLSWGFAGYGAAAGAQVAAAVLLLACPAALVLAVPATLLRVVQVGQHSGVVWRDLDALETACQASIVLFDKTGTVTHGRPQVTLMEVAGEGSETGLRALAAALAGDAEDATSDAFRHLAGEGAALPACEELTGTIETGVHARCYRENVRLGPLHFVRRFAAIPNEAVLRAQTWENTGATCYFLTVGRKLFALFGITDTLRDEAQPTLLALKQAGFRTVILSGDNTRTANSLGRLAGADKVVSELRPEQKAEFVRTLQVGGEVVVTVGDWVNDAPSLAQSDVGIAFGTDAGALTLQSARVVLLRPNLRLVPRVLALSRAALRNLRQNVVLALVVSACALPAALTLPWLGSAPWAGAAGLLLVLATGALLVFVSTFRVR